MKELHVYLNCKINGMFENVIVVDFFKNNLK